MVDETIDPVTQRIILKIDLFLETKIQLLNLIYIFTEEVSVNVYHAHNRINF